MTAIKRIIRERKGYSFAELLVSFAILLILLSATITVMTPALRIYQKMKYMSYAQSVADILIEKVSGGLASASKNVLVSVDGKSISFDDSQSSPIYVYVDDDKMLVIHYREIRIVDDNGDSDIIWDAVDWKYDKNAYQGFVISSLDFDWTGYGNSVRITLELSHERYNLSYKTTRIVECYDLSGSVSVGNTLKDDDAYYISIGIISNDIRDPNTVGLDYYTQALDLFNSGNKSRESILGQINAEEWIVIDERSYKMDINVYEDGFFVYAYDAGNRDIKFFFDYTSNTWYEYIGPGRWDVENSEITYEDISGSINTKPDFWSVVEPT